MEINVRLISHRLSILREFSVEKFLKKFGSFFGHHKSPYLKRIHRWTKTSVWIGTVAASNKESERLKASRNRIWGLGMFTFDLLECCNSCTILEVWYQTPFLLNDSQPIITDWHFCNLLSLIFHLLWKPLSVHSFTFNSPSIFKQTPLARCPV